MHIEARMALAGAQTDAFHQILHPLGPRKVSDQAPVEVIACFYIDFLELYIFLMISNSAVSSNSV